MTIQNSSHVVVLNTLLDCRWIGIKAKAEMAAAAAEETVVVVVVIVGVFFFAMVIVVVVVSEIGTDNSMQLHMTGTAWWWWWWG